MIIDNIKAINLVGRNEICPYVFSRLEIKLWMNLLQVSLFFYTKTIKSNLQRSKNERHTDYIINKHNKTIKIYFESYKTF